MNHYENMTFGRLLVTHRLPNKGKRVMWNCVCECGGTKAVSTDSLRDGKVRSCGCLRKESIAAVNFSHGSYNTRAYRSWQHMKSRCNNPKNAKYPAYGGRGISVCERWIESFENFLSDMGHPQDGHTLDRIDVNGNYEPSNCRWATSKQQGNNTRTNVFVTAFGFTGTLKQVAEKFGVSYKMVHARVARGADIESAISTPTLCANQVTVRGVTGSLREVAEHFGCNYRIVHQRIHKYGYSLEEAIDGARK